MSRQTKLVKNQLFDHQKVHELVEDLHEIVVQLVENPCFQLDRLVECGLIIIIIIIIIIQRKDLGSLNSSILLVNCKYAQRILHVFLCFVQ